MRKSTEYRAKIIQLFISKCLDGTYQNTIKYINDTLQDSQIFILSETWFQNYARYIKNPNFVASTSINREHRRTLEVWKNINDLMCSNLWKCEFMFSAYILHFQSNKIEV